MTKCFRVREARRTVPATFSGFDGRVTGLRARIVELTARSDRLLAAQASIERLVVLSADSIFIEYGVDTVW